MWNEDKSIKIQIGWYIPYMSWCGWRGVASLEGTGKCRQRVWPQFSVDCRRVTTFGKKNETGVRSWSLPVWWTLPGDQKGFFPDCLSFFAYRGGSVMWMLAVGCAWWANGYRPEFLSLMKWARRVSLCFWRHFDGTAFDRNRKQNVVKRRRKPNSLKTGYFLGMNEMK